MRLKNLITVDIFTCTAREDLFPWKNMDSSEAET